MKGTNKLKELMEIWCILTLTEISIYEKRINVFVHIVKVMAMHQGNIIYKLPLFYVVLIVVFIFLYLP